MAAANDPNKKKIKTATKNTKHKSRKFTYFCDPRGKNTVRTHPTCVLVLAIPFLTVFVNQNSINSFVSIILNDSLGPCDPLLSSPL